MSYEFTTDKIEVRSLKEGRIPRYIVNGRGMVSGIKDTYSYSKNKDGTFKTLHSMFTPNCLDSIKKQASHKRLFVDAQHDLALNINIRSMLKEKLTEDEMGRVNKMLKMKELPLAKLNDVEIKDNSLMIYSELNPAFRELDKEHEVYFDSIWYSLQNKFINGISVNFANPKVIENNDGNKLIDDIEVLGFSYVDAPASHENTIMEVAIRAMQEGEKMTEEKEKKPTEDVEEIKKEMEKTKNELKAMKEEKAKAEEEAKQKQEAEKQKSVEAQKEEQKKTVEELQKQVDELKAKKATDEDNSAKGEVKQADKYGDAAQKKQYDDKFYEENLKEITKGHRETMETIKEGKVPMIDKRMEGFAELSNLQAKINSTTGMTEEDAKFAMEHGLLKKGAGDIVTPRQK